MHKGVQQFMLALLLVGLIAPSISQADAAKTAADKTAKNPALSTAAGKAPAAKTDTAQTADNKTITDGNRQPRSTLPGLAAQLKDEYYSDPSDYHIGPLDLLEIKVLNAEDMTRTMRVDARGFINMPLIGLVQASGLTGYELENLIAEKLGKDFLQNPQVSVFIKEFTSQRLTVQGQVKKAGMYDFQGRATLLQAISMGGGIDVKGDESAIKVVRKLNNDETETMVFDLAAIRNNKAPNPYLKGGDVVVVEEMLPITVEGAVMKAGVFYMVGQPTLMQAISQAGGLHDIADPSTVKVISIKQQKRSTLEYNLEKVREGKIDDPVLQQGDLVVVEKSAARNALNMFTNTLRGFVNFGNVFQ